MISTLRRVNMRLNNFVIKHLDVQCSLHYFFVVFQLFAFQCSYESIYKPMVSGRLNYTHEHYYLNLFVMYGQCDKVLVVHLRSYLGKIRKHQQILKIIQNFKNFGSVTARAQKSKSLVNDENIKIWQWRVAKIITVNCPNCCLWTSDISRTYVAILHRWVPFLTEG